MKWIGQHIWDFISRFRNDVYLEDLSTTTETNVLVVDSDGKVSKNTTTVGGDITEVVAGTGISGGGAGPGAVTVNANLGAGLINYVGAYGSYSANHTRVDLTQGIYNGSGVGMLQNGSTNQVDIFSGVNASVLNGLTRLTRNSGFGNFSNGDGITGTTGGYNDVIYYNPTSGNKSLSGISISYLKSLDGDFTSGTLSVFGGSFSLMDFGSNAGAVNFQTAVKATVLGNTTGTSWGAGVDVDVSGCDTNDGVVITTTDGGNGYDLKITSSASGGDFFGIATGANGVTEIKTLDTGSDVAHLSFDINGDIFLDPDANVFINSSKVTQTYSADGGTDTAFLLQASTGQQDNSTLVGWGASISNGSNNINAGQTVNVKGIYQTVDDYATGNVGDSKLYGLQQIMSFSGAGGNTEGYGIHTTLAGGDVGNNVGLYQKISDGSLDLKFVSFANTADYFSVATTTNGATTIKTVDADSDLANLNLEVDGVLFVDSKRLSYTEPGSNIGFYKFFSIADSADYFRIGLGENGNVVLETVDAVGNEGDFHIQADGAVDIDSASGEDITIDSGGNIKLEPASGSNILLDGTVTVDAGSVTGLTTLGVDSVNITAVQTSSESFSNDDTSIMTSAAIDDRIPDETTANNETFVLKTAKVTITQAQWNSLHTTPIDLVAAPGANKQIVPISGTLAVDRLTTQANALADLNVHYDLGGGVGSYFTNIYMHVRRFMWNKSTDITYSLAPFSYEIAQSKTVFQNKKLQVSVDAELRDSGGTQNCIGDSDIYISYYILDMS